MGDGAMPGMPAAPPILRPAPIGVVLRRALAAAARRSLRHTWFRYTATASSGFLPQNRPGANAHRPTKRTHRR
jgi:hypothetical protein